MAEFDFNDSAIRDMVERNHRPEEKRRIDGSLRVVACEECSETWPCFTTLTLRAWYDLKNKKSGVR